MTNTTVNDFIDLVEVSYAPFSKNVVQQLAFCLKITSLQNVCVSLHITLCVKGIG